jgi:hypothetical protein
MSGLSVRGLVLSVLLISPALAYGQQATWIYPAPGTSSPISQPVTFRWSTVSGAQTYYLYVGTAPGLKDLVDTGEIPATEFTPAIALPSGPVYARIYTLVAGRWLFSDTSFTVQSRAAQWISPAAGTLGSLPMRFSWTSIPGATTYYLYVGTAPGLKNLVDTGEIPSTSYDVPWLPSGQTVYARIWTLYGGRWSYADTSFTLRNSLATFTSPTHGATVNAPVAFTWTSVPAAQAYYLYVGTAPGKNDLVNTGEIQTTSWPAANLPAGVTLYARIYTHALDVWRFTEIAFKVNDWRARFIVPGAEGLSHPVPITFSWTEVEGATAYYLRIGSSPGLGDYLDTGELTTLSHTVSSLPVGPLLHARLYTLANGVWRFVDRTFAARSTHAEWIYPRNLDYRVDPSRGFQWTTPGSPGYRLTVGRQPGGSELLDTGEFVGGSYPMAGLPQNEVLYARISSRVTPWWYPRDIRFSINGSSTAATMVYPANGASNVDGRAFEWREAAFATAYRLKLGRQPGGSELLDTGNVLVTRMFASALPANTLIRGTLTTKTRFGDQSVAFSFTTGPFTDATPADRRALVEWAVARVRNMAGLSNVAVPGTLLARTLDGLGFVWAFCSEYADVLVAALEQMRLPDAARRIDVCLQTNFYDCHSLNEVRDAGANRWWVVDPTMGMVVRRPDGSAASATDIQTATAEQQWTGVVYQPLTSYGLTLPAGYYLDYPLLFRNIFLAGAVVPFADPGTLAFFEPVAAPVSTQGVYALRCPPTASSVNAIVDGSLATIPCLAPDTLTYVFSAGTITEWPQAPGSLRVYRPKRFRF